MWERFGEMNSAAELNRTAEGLRNEKDIESLTILAVENGLDQADAEDYADECMDELFTPLTAAMGKIAIEKKELNVDENSIMKDWIDYIIVKCSEDPEIAIQVRTKEKSLAGCIGVLLKYSYENQWTVPSEITKAAGINAGRVTLGEPDMGTAKDIIKNYYLGE